jgi:hypothetical protein
VAVQSTGQRRVSLRTGLWTDEMIITLRGDLAAAEGGVIVNLQAKRGGRYMVNPSAEGGVILLCGQQRCMCLVGKVDKPACL